MESLKRARKAKGLSLAQLAELTGVHAVSIARAERPDVDPSVATLVAISKALDIPVCELLDEKTSHANHRRRKRR